ncbi:FAD binding domain-containing protein [Allonocardiopsis opalescens]|uniref:Xanthine dehydrogenase YagS FAD-binding subunit n=1 Tax=Allonocardiopsis opalescens TaxID=1144618 RepID=A0A2T0PTC9_9ACTN|nr:FAD binding domain-containing protein [Allonocardiopsis opalescens]PRX92155.1 xanthine dehydrogenase YagS FAD-binding subunit [Allonocardiopsis opalescens]
MSTTAPTSLDGVAEALASGGRPRAGGTDLTVLHRLGLARGPYVDLGGVAALGGVGWRADGSARIGATTPIAEIAADERLRAAYPALTATAAALATPQVRAAATLGGNLLQRNRCSYLRNPHFSCHQSGGTGCPARTGVHANGVAVDQGPCVAPHPSSLAMALVGYGATAETRARGTLAVADLYGDGSDPTRDHLLPEGEVLLAVDLPVPEPGERAAYRRATARTAAEWPLVEAVARLVVTDGRVRAAGVAAGGVARTPLRLTEVEQALIGRPADAAVLAAAAALAAERCRPLPQTGYKVGLLRDTVRDVLERAAEQG